MNIRLAQERDLPTILTIYNHSIVHTTSVYSYDPWTTAMIEDWYEAKQIAEFPILVAESENEILGYASYGAFRNWPGYRYSVEHSVHIDAKHQRKGIAKLLLEELIAIAQSKGLHVMIGCVDADNQGSVQFHERLGFVEVGYMKEVGFKFDRWLDLKILQLVLQKNN